MSPDVGVLVEEAVERALEDDPDDTLSLLADLTAATDPRLRELAKRLAGRITVDVARRGTARTRGIGKLQLQPLDERGADLDVDASMDPLVEARAGAAAPRVGDLRARGWARPATALCLVVDRSGSMSGEKLATAAVAAAAVAWRAPSDYSVLLFAADVIVAKAQGQPRSPEQVVDAVLSLRGHGTTDLALALRAAAEQLARTRAARRITVLLSDCRATVEGDVEAAARQLDELVIVAPEADSEDAEALSRRVGAAMATLGGPSQVPEVLARLL